MKGDLSKTIKTVPGNCLQPAPTAPATQGGRGGEPAQCSRGG